MLNQDYKDILSCLKKRGADFLIVGAYAMAAHGQPRATGDIDIFIRPDHDNAKKVRLALSDFGAALADISETDLASKGNVIQIGVAPCRVDILTAIDGVDFALAWKNRKPVSIEGIELDVISVGDLIVNKSSTGRKQDELDVIVLEKMRGR
jgi:predicted nucleotidyltransferase